MSLTYKRTLMISVLIIVLLLMTLLFTGKYVLNLVFEDACANDIVQTLPSPDEKRMAYVFKRDCGATTDYSYQLSILKADEEFQNKAGNAFISEKSLTVQWTDARQLEVQYALEAQSSKMKREVDGVQIEYIPWSQ